MPEISVPPEAAGERLDRFLAAALAPALSRVRVQTIIRETANGGDRAPVRINGRPAAKPSEPLRAGDVIFYDAESLLAPTGPATAPPAPEDIALDVLFEDADLLVVNKPAGLVTHPGAGNWQGTLVNALVHHLGGDPAALSAAGGAERPGIVHRLDKDTSGCLVVAKNDFAHRALAAQFAGRTTEKRYLALVWGTPRLPGGLIDAPIGRHPVQRQKMAIVPPPRGRTAQTEWRLRGAIAKRFSLIECRLLTGRTHQIRVHLKHLGHPILGDTLYAAGPAAAAAPRQMLHAWRLGFQHPRGEGRAPLEFRAPLPADFLAFGLDPREFENPP